MDRPRSDRARRQQINKAEYGGLRFDLGQGELLLRTHHSVARQTCR